MNVVVLDMYGIIEKTLISKKLHLYVANLPNEKHNEWNEYLFEVMNKEIKQREIDSLEFENNYGKKLGLYDLKYMKRIYELNFNFGIIDEKSEIEKYIQYFANHMIYLFFDYNYDYFSFFDWATNCFDGRLCEEDYAEKIIKLIRFITRHSVDAVTPACIYSSNQDDFGKTRVLQILQFKREVSKEKYIAELQKWGQKIDEFLEEENDFYQLDYLINALYKGNEYNTNHLFKDFSILEMLLVKEGVKTNTIDNKLSIFLQEEYEDESKNVAKLLRQMRNKIGHGDFNGFYEKAEEYARLYMMNYNFDYSEYSRVNWILLHVCCLLDDLIAKVIKIMFENKPKLLEIKNQ